MTFEDDIVLLGRLTQALTGLLGNQSTPARAERLREMADLLTDFSTYLRNRADELVTP